MSTSTTTRIAAGVLAISFCLFVSACEKGGTPTTPPDGDEAAGEEGGEEGGEEPAEEGGEEGGW